MTLAIILFVVGILLMILGLAGFMYLLLSLDTNDPITKEQYDWNEWSKTTGL